MFSGMHKFQGLVVFRESVIHCCICLASSGQQQDVFVILELLLEDFVLNGMILYFIVVYTSIIHV